jgi:hypothetical protein
VCFFSNCIKKPPDSIVLKNAHAHNDYENERPLIDALALGFISIEADIHLKEDQLYVAHDSVDILEDWTLQSLYLDPLKEKIQKNKGMVYNKANRLILLIDIKTDALETYKKLHEELQRYRDMLTTFENDLAKPGPVLAIISGNRPISYIRDQRVRYAAIDGRFENLNAEQKALLFPLISENWTDHFSWRGKDSMPSNEEDKLARLVKKIHGNGQMLRFWATPDSASSARDSLWTGLLKYGVDLIGTDDLEGLSAFLKKNE